jgi:hypothetical protein
MAYICRHTSLTPNDVFEMTPYQYRIFIEKLSDIIAQQNGAEAGGNR